MLCSCVEEENTIEETPPTTEQTIEKFVITETKDGQKLWELYADEGRYTDSAIRLTRLRGSSTPAKVYATLGIRELELV